MLKYRKAYINKISAESIPFQENKTLSIIAFLLPFSAGSTLYGKSLLQEEQILSFKSFPLYIYRKFCRQKKQTGCHRPSFFLFKMALFFKNISLLKGYCYQTKQTGCNIRFFFSFSFFRMAENMALYPYSLK